MLTLLEHQNMREQKATAPAVELCINNVEILNKLMFAKAHQGKTYDITRLFKYMALSNGLLKPNLNSFTAALQSIGYEMTCEKSSTFANNVRVQRILADMSKSQVCPCNNNNNNNKINSKNLK